MPSFALAAIGRDRPGIVAAVAEVLYEHGCNIEDSSMTMLRGNFSIMLVLTSPGSATAGDLTEALRGACDELGLTISVLGVDDRPVTPHPSHILTVYGADRPGILFRVTRTLADRDVNITDLDSRIVGSADDPVYAMLLELALPATLEPEVLDEALHAAATEIGIDLTLRPLDQDVL